MNNIMYFFQHFGGYQHPYTLSSSVVILQFLIHDADSQQNKKDIEPGSDKDDAEVPQHTNTSKNSCTTEIPPLIKDARDETRPEEMTDSVVTGIHALLACMHACII